MVRLPGSSLAVALLGAFIVTLDALVINVALPAIERDLGGGLTGLLWVVDGYTLMFAALLLFGGTLSDRIGARQAFGIGLAIFIVASAACAPAPRAACSTRPARSGALAIAVFGALVAHQAAFVDGVRISFLIAALLLLATAAVSVSMLAGREHLQVSPQP